MCQEQTLLASVYINQRGEGHSAILTQKILALRGNVCELDIHDSPTDFNLHIPTRIRIVSSIKWHSHTSNAINARSVPDIVIHTLRVTLLSDSGMRLLVTNIVPESCDLMIAALLSSP